MKIFFQIKFQIRPISLFKLVPKMKKNNTPNGSNTIFFTLRVVFSNFRINPSPMFFSHNRGCLKIMNCEKNLSQIQILLANIRKDKN